MLNINNIVWFRLELKKEKCIYFLYPCSITCNIICIVKDTKTYIGYKALLCYFKDNSEKCFV